MIGVARIAPRKPGNAPARAEGGETGGKSVLHGIAVARARNVRMKMHGDAFDERGFGVLWLGPFLRGKFLDATGHVILNGEDHVLQIAAAHQHAHRRIGDQEIRSRWAVMRDVDKQVIAR